MGCIRSQSSYFCASSKGNAPMQTGLQRKPSEMVWRSDKGHITGSSSSSFCAPLWLQQNRCILLKALGLSRSAVCVLHIVGL